MSARDNMLARIRASLGRTAGQPQPPPPLYVEHKAIEDRTHVFRTRLELLNAQTYQTSSEQEAASIIARIVGDGLVYASGKGNRFTASLAITDDVACAHFGVTGADYGLAETATLVTFANTDERLASLLPPVHIAVIEESRILANLDELLEIVPLPASAASSMVLISGPSRTGDIEQILVRGVHGPGELHVLVFSGLING